MRTRSLSALVFATVAAVSGRDLGSDGDEPSRERPPMSGAPSGGASASLADRLRRGGYVLAFRHAATDFSMGRSPRLVRLAGTALRQRVERREACRV